MNHFVLRHSMSLRVPLSLYQWICTKSDAEGLPPSTYAIRRLEEMAQLDLLQDGQDGDAA